MRRRDARGQVTDTAPRLDAWAYVEDTRADPLQLAMLVDTWPARAALVPELLPLWVGLHYDGRGDSLPIRPDRFVLEWRGRTVTALNQEALLAQPDGLRALRRDHGGAGVSRPVPPDWSAARWPVRFYNDPQRTLYRRDDQALPARAWFRDLLYFHVPADIDRWNESFTLRYRGDDDGRGALALAFRIPRDPTEERRAFRKASKARKKDR